MQDVRAVKLRRQVVGSLRLSCGAIRRKCEDVGQRGEEPGRWIEVKS